MNDSATESDFLQNYVSELEEQGYEVFIQPQSPILPSFLKGFRPDIIARRDGKSVVVQIVRKSEVRQKTLAEMATLIQANPGWEMRIVVVNPTSDVSALSKQPLEAIQQSADEVNKLRESGHSRAALLMAWSTFEALARLTLPLTFARPQSPGRLVQLLAQEGYVTPTEADVLRTLAEKRNLLIHGNVRTHVSEADLESFAVILKNLMDTQQASP
jgi:uncharacterized protein YutE (UPF0331/DUF86 family)